MPVLLKLMNGVLKCCFIKRSQPNAAMNAGEEAEIGQHKKELELALQGKSLEEQISFLQAQGKAYAQLGLFKEVEDWIRDKIAAISVVISAQASPRTGHGESLLEKYRKVEERIQAINQEISALTAQQASQGAGTIKFLSEQEVVKSKQEWVAGSSMIEAASAFVHQGEIVISAQQVNKNRVYWSKLHGDWTIARLGVNNFPANSPYRMGQPPFEHDGHIFQVTKINGHVSVYQLTASGNALVGNDIIKKDCFYSGLFEYQGKLTLLIEASGRGMELYQLDQNNTWQKFTTLPETKSLSYVVHFEWQGKIIVAYEVEIPSSNGERIWKAFEFDGKIWRSCNDLLPERLKDSGGISVFEWAGDLYLTTSTAYLQTFKYDKGEFIPLEAAPVSFRRNVSPVPFGYGHDMFIMDIDTDSSGGWAKVWDMKGQPVLTFQYSDYPSYCSGFSIFSDGKDIYMTLGRTRGDGDHNVKVWHIGTIEGPAQKPRAWDGQRLIDTSNDNEHPIIESHELAAFKQALGLLEEHKNALDKELDNLRKMVKPNILRWSLPFLRLLIIGEGGVKRASDHVFQWELETDDSGIYFQKRDGTGSKTYVGHAGLGLYAFSGDGRFLCFTQGSKYALWQLDNDQWKKKAEFNIIKNPSKGGIVFSPDHKHAILEDNDILKVLNEQGIPVTELFMDHDIPTQWGYSLDNNWIIALDENLGVYLWKMDEQSEIFTSPEPQTGVIKVLTEPTKALKPPDSWRDSVHFIFPDWEVSRKRDHEVYVRHWNGNLWEDVNFDTNIAHNKLALDIIGHHVNVSKLVNGKFVHTLTLRHRHLVKGVAKTSDSQWVVTLDDHDMVQIWSMVDAAMKTVEADEFQAEKDALGNEIQGKPLEEQVQILERERNTYAVLVEDHKPYKILIAWINGKVIELQGRISQEKKKKPASIQPVNKDKNDNDKMMLKETRIKIQDLMMEISRMQAVVASGGITFELLPKKEIHEIRKIDHVHYSGNVVLLKEKKYIYSSPKEGALSVWNLNDPLDKPLRSFPRAHGALIYDIAPTSGGKKVVTASFDNTLKIWDINAGKELHTLTGHSHPVMGVALTLDKVVSASMDETVKVWDLNSGGILKTLTGHNEPVYEVAVSKDGKYAVSAGEHSLIKWDLDKGKDVFTFSRNMGRTGRIIFTPDMKYVLTSTRRSIKVWDFQTGKLMKKMFKSKHLTKYNDFISAFTITSDGKYVLMGNAESGLTIWDWNSGDEVFYQDMEKGYVHDIDVAADGNLIWTSKEGSLNVWGAFKAYKDADAPAKLKALQTDLTRLKRFKTKLEKSIRDQKKAAPSVVMPGPIKRID